MTNPLVKLNSLGQSIWFDNIERSMLDKGGTLAQLIAEDDLRGVTSNPAIFEKAIKNSNLYDAQLLALSNANPSITSREAFFELAIEDIVKACDLMLPVYQKTKGIDGMISLEVSPDLAHKTQETVDEALYLWKRLNRPNAMIKVPATIEALPAITQLVAQGVNVNVTLLFSVERYIKVAQAYIEGLKQRVKFGLAVDNVISVASFFVSRLDSNLEPILNAKKLDNLQAKVAIANAKLAYQEFLALFSSAEFKELITKGAKVQRLLWASTGTKNPKFSDVLYVEELIGENTVNTVPPATYAAFKDHGLAKLTILEQAQEARVLVEQTLASHQIDLSAITQQLENDGLKQFEDAFTNLLAGIENKLR